MTEEVKKAADAQAENEQENLDSKNESEKDTQETTEAQTDEDAKGGDVEKQEESPYKADLEKLNTELSKKDDIISKKNRALEAEKDRRKKAEQALEERDGGSEEEKSLEERLRAEFDAKLQKKDFETLLNSFSTDEVQKELIRKTYDHKVVKSGDVKEDFETAVAIAHRRVVFEQRERQAQQEQEESDMAYYQSSDVKSNASLKGQDPVKKLAAQLLTNMGEDKAIKKLNS